MSSRAVFNNQSSPAKDDIESLLLPFERDPGNIDAALSFGERPMEKLNYVFEALASTPRPSAAEKAGLLASCVPALEDLALHLAAGRALSGRYLLQYLPESATATANKDNEEAALRRAQVYKAMYHLSERVDAMERCFDDMLYQMQQPAARNETRDAVRITSIQGGKALRL